MVEEGLAVFESGGGGDAESADGGERRRIDDVAGDDDGGSNEALRREFFGMGGYALYVWGSYGVTALLLIAEVLMVRARSKRARSQAHDHFGGARERAA